MTASDRPFDDRVRQLVSDCAALGVRAPVTLRVRVALRRRLHLGQRLRLALLALLALLPAGVVGGAAWWTGAWLRRHRPPWWPEDWWFREDVSGLTAWVEQSPVHMYLGGLLVMCVLFLWLFLDASLDTPHETRRRVTQASRVLLARRYALVAQCAAVIHACAETRRGGLRRARHLRRVSKRLKVVRRSVLDAHRSRGTVPVFSPRRKRLKRHERRVCAALEEIESRLDRDPDGALRDLADALLTLADRYCQGRVGHLLDDELLAGVRLRHRWEVARHLLALVLAAAGIVALGRSGLLPDGTESFVFGIVFVTAFLLALGRNFRRYLDVLNTITGGP